MHKIFAICVLALSAIAAHGQGTVVLYEGARLIPGDGGPAITGELAHGKLDTNALKSMFGSAPDAPWRKLVSLRMTSAERGIHPDILAMHVGFDSGRDLVDALAILGLCRLGGDEGGVHGSHCWRDPVADVSRKLQLIVITPKARSVSDVKMQGHTNPLVSRSKSR